MSKHPVLVALLPALLDACSGPCRYTVDDAWESVAVPDDELGRAQADGVLSQAECEELCQHLAAEEQVEELLSVYECTTVPPRTSASKMSTSTSPMGDTGGPDGVLHCRVDYVSDYACEGRRHRALHPPRRWPASGSVQARLARSAFLEAASVGAFRRLRRELLEHGAPADLVERARAAAFDEISHARMLRALAGSPPPRVTFAPHRPRSWFALARENAVEGCAGETFGALVAHHQARHAAPALRPVFQRIAIDETRHGQWSWDLDRWLRTRLSPGQRAELDGARDCALRDLGHTGAAPAARHVLGLPSPEQASALADRLRAALAA